MNELQLTHVEQNVLKCIIENKEPPGEDNPGKLRMSLIEIARRANTSPASAYRALEKLKLLRKIYILPSEDKRQPSEIVYCVTTDDAPSLRELFIKLREHLMDAQKALEQLYVRSQWDAAVADLVQGIDYDILRVLRDHRIVGKSTLPDGKMALILEPKDTIGSSHTYPPTES